MRVLPGHCCRHCLDNDKVVPLWSQRVFAAIVLSRVAYPLHQILDVGSTALEIPGVFGASPLNVFLPNNEKLDLPWRT